MQAHQLLTSDEQDTCRAFEVIMRKVFALPGVSSFGVDILGFSEPFFSVQIQSDGNVFSGRDCQDHYQPDLADSIGRALLNYSRNNASFRSQKQVAA